jgi:hypothetical protein
MMIIDVTVRPCAIHLLCCIFCALTHRRNYLQEPPHFPTTIAAMSALAELRDKDNVSIRRGLAALNDCTEEVVRALHLSALVQTFGLDHWECYLSFSH